MMNDKFSKALTESLNYECDDYGIEYTWEYDPDAGECLVEITKDGRHSVEVYFKYDADNDDLKMEMYEDVYEVIRHYNTSVKHFWLRVAPELFPVE